jgi:hypothetical protein
MGDKIRGTIAIVVGVFALWQSYVLYRAGRVDWHTWVEVAATQSRGAAWSGSPP